MRPFASSLIEIIYLFIIKKADEGTGWKSEPIQG